MEAYSSVGRSTGYTEETLNLSMTAKHGRVSWFRYEELVDDWVTFTTIDASRRGPLLKSRLTGDAHSTRQPSRTTSCKILTKESTISRTR